MLDGPALLLPNKNWAGHPKLFSAETLFISNLWVAVTERKVSRTPHTQRQNLTWPFRPMAFGPSGKWCPASITRRRFKTQCLVNQPLVSSLARWCGKPRLQRESVSRQKAPARANLPRLWTTVEKFPQERHKVPFPLGVAETVHEHTQIWYSFHSGA